MAGAKDDKGKRSKGDLVEWFTVSYRTLYIAGALVAGIALCVYSTCSGEDRRP
jgi:hypothetical protein